jgi:c-di-GMP-binding flagellar brake protein YcgR
MLDIAAEIGASARLYLPDAREAFATAVRLRDDDSLVLDPVFPEHGNLVLERVKNGLRIEITVAGVPMAGMVDVVNVDDSALRVSIPPRLSKVQRRRYFRVPAPEGTDVQLQVGDDVRCRALVDISAMGAAVRVHTSDTDLVPGKEIELFQLALSGGRSFVAAATVKQRAVRAPSWSTERIVGLEFEGVSARDRDRLHAWITERERSVLRERSREPARAVNDAVLVIHGPGNRTRLRAVSQLGARTLTIALTDDDDDMSLGVQFTTMELRISGQVVLRASMRVERLLVVEGRSSAALGFGDLRPEERQKLLNLLRG